MTTKSNYVSICDNYNCRKEEIQESEGLPEGWRHISLSISVFTKTAARTLHYLDADVCSVECEVDLIKNKIYDPSYHRLWNTYG